MSRITRLSNGITVVTKTITGAQSASLGLWLDVGSRDERPASNGVSHFFEHMAFKGTHSKSGLDIVRVLESKGGQINAYTTKENTCFYSRVVASEAETALETLLDMVLDPLMDSSELEKEREVILEELKGSDDNPEERVYDLFSRAIYGTDGLGYPVGGTLQSVQRLSRVQLLNHWKRICLEMPIYLVAVGEVSHRRIVALTQKISSGKLGKFKRRSIRRCMPSRKFRPTRPRHLWERRDIQQASVILAAPGFSSLDWRSYPLAILNCVLGEGMSSRLFQIMREDEGLVYNVNSFVETHINAGAVGVSFNCDPKNIRPCVKLVMEELEKLEKEGIRQEELEFAIQNITGNFLLDMESTSSMMSFLARTAMSKKSIKTPAQFLNQIRSVRLGQTKRVSKVLYARNNWISAAVMPKGVRSLPSRLME